MGQKVNPVGFRLGVIRSWDSKWYEEKNYARWLHEDIRLREYVKKKLGQAGISKVEIERAASKVKVNVHTARPGIVIGKRGAGIESIKKELQQFTQNEVFLNIVEVRKAETDAQLVAENITTQLERRIAFRRAMKKAIQTAQKGRHKGKAYRGGDLAFGDYGLKVLESGRLTARQIEAGRIAMTRFIKRGGKVWIRVFPDKPVTKKPAETRMGHGKGNVEEWHAVVKMGRILYEMEGVTEEIAKKAMSLAAHKLPLHTRLVRRSAELGA